MIITSKGNQPSDGGNLILSEQEYHNLIVAQEDIQPFVKRYVGARDYINNDEVRYCLWLKDADPSVYRKIKL